jgi:hypothetical protein
MIAEHRLFTRQWIVNAAARLDCVGNRGMPLGVRVETKQFVTQISTD